MKEGKSPGVFLATYLTSLKLSVILHIEQVVIIWHRKEITMMSWG